MTTSAAEARARTVWCDDESLWVALADGRRLAVPLAFFPRLLRASPAEREGWQLSGEGRAIHWEALDEDVSVAGLLAGAGDREAAGRAR